MPKELRAPQFPETPEAWLCRYRHRHRDEDDHPLSPERLGGMLGVSGATVRRWESGGSRPSEADLRHFANVCSLSHLETEFILAAFKPREIEVAPERNFFEAVVGDILLSEHPAFILDSLFYRRAWNSHLKGMYRKSSGNPSAGNVLGTTLNSFYSSGTPGARDEFQARWIRDFWLYTAHLCGSEPYRQLLNELADQPVFHRLWTDLGLTSDGTSAAVGAPYYYQHPRIGTYRVFTLRLMLPPAYYLKEYVPVDNIARGHIDKVRAINQPGIVFVQDHHWSLEGPRASDVQQGEPGHSQRALAAGSLKVTTL